MRRVITGLDDDGRSCVIADEEAPEFAGAGVQMWSGGADDVPWAAQIPADAVAPALEPERGESSFRIVTFPPVEVYRKLIVERPLEGIDAEGRHTTRTVDYIHILNGDIFLDLDTESVLLKPGDSVVQRATRHAWRSPEGATLLTVLVDLQGPSRLG